jgi:hypothetical protein
MRPLPISRHCVPSRAVWPWWIWLEANQRSATINSRAAAATLIDAATAGAKG